MPQITLCVYCLQPIDREKDDYVVDPKNGDPHHVACWVKQHAKPE